MKKIIALFVFMLAFGLTANAQQNTAKQGAQTSVQQKIKQSAAKDVALLMEVIELDADDKQRFFDLFENKHSLLQQNLSEDRKTELAKAIKAKMEAILDADQNAKLAQVPSLMEKLTH